MTGIDYRDIKEEMVVKSTLFIIINLLSLAAWAKCNDLFFEVIRKVSHYCCVS